MPVPLCSCLALLLTCAAVGYAGTLDNQAEASDVNLIALATANNDLALSIHRQFRSSENVFFSPLSLSTTFGMLYYGTRGQTAKELRKALGFQCTCLKEELVHRTVRKYLTEYLTNQNSSAYVLNSANAILLDRNLKLVPSYKTEVQDLYQASVKDYDFSTQGPQIVREINEWVQEKTNGKIDKLLDDLDASAALVLLNAVYFKGTWKTEFDPKDTALWMFHNNGLEKTVKVPMMRMTGQLPFVELDDAKALELGYKGDNFSMIVLLPNDLDGLECLERSLNSEKLDIILSSLDFSQLNKKEVHVTIPKFKLEYSRELSREFQSVGARRVFTPGSDFSGITTSGKLAVSQVLHKAVIEVNEEGSEAAAVTGIITNRMGDSTHDFTVDRPFLFMIVDKRNNMVVFLGRVTKL